ncbi:cobalamin-independent synthase, Catalytic domain protein [Mycobacterium xenopi 4042]|uniref:Cobalamin-independent synthase, Catalytic domain protein n=1 Tax=Mycobacterium xenopi 4042 TaxID=1299334 RepID=X7Z5Q5_MYCXE|nr:cobalamin-independent synthase, Catalytic domain protein [Mycobacterium xenopi 4042]
MGADMIGRAGALLIDVAIDTVPRGYRVAARPGAVMRRAASLLDEDIDALEEAWEEAGLRGSGRPVKVQAPDRSRWRPSWSWPTGTGRSPIPVPCVTSPRHWPRESPLTGPRYRGGSTLRSRSSSTSRRCRPRWPGD